MNGQKLVKAVMEERGHGNTSLAKALGCSTPSYISEKLRRKKSMSLEWFVRMLNAMNCEVIIRSTLKDKKEWILTNDFDDDEE